MYITINYSHNNLQDQLIPLFLATVLTNKLVILTILLLQCTYIHTYIPVFCPGYLEWWLDFTLHLVLFIQFILNSVSVAYICII